jgi:ATP-dependent Clp protease adaptor protein ClpS
MDRPMEQESSTAVAEPKAKVAPRQDPRQKPKAMPPFNVVLIDDQMHTYAYVIEMLRNVFGYNDPKGYAMAREVDTRGRVIIYTAHKELAELKRDQVTDFGPDVRMAASTRGMNAVIEPAEGDSRS